MAQVNPMAVVNRYGGLGEGLVRPPLSGSQLAISTSAVSAAAKPVIPARSCNWKAMVRSTLPE